MSEEMDVLLPELTEQYKGLSDDEILRTLDAIPVLADEGDERWDDDSYWAEVGVPYLALAEAAASHKLRGAVAPLLKRASYGDPYESMRGLRHSLEEIMDPDWGALADSCIAAVMSQERGARLWSVSELGILREPKSLATLTAALDDPTILVRDAACQSLSMLAQRIPDLWPAIEAALVTHLERYEGISEPNEWGTTDTRAAVSALDTIKRPSERAVVAVRKYLSAPDPGLSSAARATWKAFGLELPG